MEYARAILEWYERLGLLAAVADSVFLLTCDGIVGHA